MRMLYFVEELILGHECPINTIIYRAVLWSAVGSWNVVPLINLVYPMTNSTILYVVFLPTSCIYVTASALHRDAQVSGV